MLQAMHGLLISVILFHKKFRTSIKCKGFKVNPHDPCVMNKEAHGSQMMIMWHVDDMKSSHIDSKVNDSFTTWLEKECSQLGEVKSSRGEQHDCLGMILDCTVDGKPMVDMNEHIKKMMTNSHKKLCKVQ